MLDGPWKNSFFHLCMHFFSFIKNLQTFVFEVLPAQYLIIFLSPGGGGFEGKNQAPGSGNWSSFDSMLFTNPHFVPGWGGRGLY